MLPSIQQTLLELDTVE
jgi:hypothetical protein